jgi:hypothetical protein
MQEQQSFHPTIEQLPLIRWFMIRDAVCFGIVLFCGLAALILSRLLEQDSYAALGMNVMITGVYMFILLSCSYHCLRHSHLEMLAHEASNEAPLLTCGDATTMTTSVPSIP